MGHVKTLFKGTPIITDEAFDKIKTGDEEILRKLYFHTNDSIQMVLIEIIFEKNGWILNGEEGTAA
jgi:hypothetical protein